MTNKIKELLIKLGISDDESIIPHYPRVRDREDVAVLKCRKSGVILLSRSDHMDISHYEEQESMSYWSAKDREAAILAQFDDSHRRANQFCDLIINKKWLDVGTGTGAILDLLAPVAAKTVAVEPQNFIRTELQNLGYNVHSLVKDVKENDFDIVTMFHVLEHLTDPLGTLGAIRQRMAKGGKLIVEVPHAKDFLLEFLDLEAFKAFTFWSEHLILHTRESLNKFLEATGFTNISIQGFQRYPLANHLHWLAKGQPGGHTKWPHLRTPEADQAYANLLNSLNFTDTLIATACVE